MRIKGLNKREIASQIIYSHNIKRINYMSIEYLRELLIEAMEVGYNWSKRYDDETQTNKTTN